MGEFADYEIARLLGEVPMRRKQQPYRPAKVACKYCEARNLEWKETEAGWRLFDGGAPHHCEAYIEARASEVLQQRESGSPVPSPHSLRPGYRPKYQSKPPQGRAAPSSGGNLARCRHCGTLAGMAFGTGDCGCEDDYDVGF